MSNEAGKLFFNWDITEVTVKERRIQKQTVVSYWIVGTKDNSLDLRIKTKATWENSHIFDQHMEFQNSDKTPYGIFHQPDKHHRYTPR